MSFSEPVSAFEMRRHLDVDHAISGRGLDWYGLVAVHATDHDKGDVAIAHEHETAVR